MTALTTLYPVAIVAVIASLIFGMVEDASADKFDKPTLTLQNVLESF
jgi:hypothetical protein